MIVHLQRLAQTLEQAPDRSANSVQDRKILDRFIPQHAGVFLDPRALCGASDDLPGLLRELTELEGDLSRRRFLDTRVLTWLPCYLVTLERLESDLADAITRDLIDTVYALRESLHDKRKPAHFNLPPSGLHLNDTDTGLHDVAAWLAAPARCGLYLTHIDMANMGIFRTEGGRRAELYKLLESAARFNKVGLVARSVARVAKEASKRLSVAPHDSEWLNPLVEPWLVRLDETMDLLARLAAAAEVTETESVRLPN